MRTRPLAAILILVATSLAIFVGLAASFALLTVEWKLSTFAAEFADLFFSGLRFDPTSSGQILGFVSIGSFIVMLLLVSFRANWCAKHPILAGSAVAVGATLVGALIVHGLSVAAVSTFFFALYLGSMFGPLLVIALVAGLGVRQVVKLDGLLDAPGRIPFGAVDPSPKKTDDDLAEDLIVDRQLGY